jgi:MFS family permease
MLAAGSLGDFLGRKRIMLAGVAVFCVGSVLAALAPNVDVLLAARAVMGLGAAASEPGTLSMIRHIYLEPRSRARALGIWTAVSGLALALGPLVGGILVGLWSWRAVFWFNLFFGLVAFAAGAVVLPESKEPGRKRFDFGGFVFGAGAIALMAFAVMSGETNGYRTWWVAALFAVGVVSLATFLVTETRSPNPILNVGYFRRPAFAGANIVALTSYFGIFSIFFFVALYLQEVGSSSGYATALDFVPMAGGMIVAAVLTGRWVAARGPRDPMITGCLLACAGIALTVIVIQPHSTVTSIGWPLGLAGIGFGIVMVPVTAVGLSAIPASHSGMAASMTNTSRELGAVAGVTILGSIVNGQLTVNLLQRLTAIGIPKVYQQVVVSAVTTGVIGGEAKKYSGIGGTIGTFVKEVV